MAALNEMLRCLFLNQIMELSYRGHRPLAGLNSVLFESLQLEKSKILETLSAEFHCNDFAISHLAVLMIFFKKYSFLWILQLTDVFLSQGQCGCPVQLQGWLLHPSLKTKQFHWFERCHTWLEALLAPRDYLHLKTYRIYSKTDRFIPFPFGKQEAKGHKWFLPCWMVTHPNSRTFSKPSSVLHSFSDEHEQEFYRTLLP